MRPRYFSAAGNVLECGLCPRRCRIAPGAAGSCGLRENKEGEMRIPFAGRLTGTALDPVEKKPLYHYRPGAMILSAGFAGCNLRCPFCQNWRISQSTGGAGPFAPPEKLVSAALEAAEAVKGPPQIAYTYSEPLAHIEYLLACMEEARRRGVSNVLVSNGCVETGPAKDALSLAGAVNIDLKCFSEETYSRVLGGCLETVLGFIRLAFEMKVHLEITTLVVPGLNDSEEELDRAASFIAGLSKEIPWHLSAYHPAWRYNAPPTDPSMLVRAAQRASEKLSFVYAGNIDAPSRFSDTRCPHCGAVLVSRTGFRADTSGLVLKGGPAARYFCKTCEKPAPINY